MFDYICVEKDLPGLPDGIFSNDEKVFQTKDTPNQTMSHYKIDSAGMLWVKEVRGHWGENKPVSEDASIGERLAALGKFIVDEEWWTWAHFTGAINFYESISHPEYSDCELASKSNKWMRFEYGWIEYRALFDDGKLVKDIELIEYKEPRKLSDEELEERESKQKQNRQEIEAFLRKNRKETPTVEQKLIDNIDRECKLMNSMMDEDDAPLALTNIKFLIEEYRKKYDSYYE